MFRPVSPLRYCISRHNMALVSIYYLPRTCYLLCWEVKTAIHHARQACWRHSAIDFKQYDKGQFAGISSVHEGTFFYAGLTQRKY